MQIVSGVIIPLVAVAITVFFTTRIENNVLKKTKLMEIRYQYLSKSLEELNSIEIKLMECVRLMDSCLIKQNPEERRNVVNQIMKEISEVNTHILSFTVNQEPLNNAIGIDLDLKGLHDKLAGITEKLHDLFMDYLQKVDTSKFVGEANDLTQQAKEDILKCVKCISDEMIKLLK